MKFSKTFVVADLHLGHKGVCVFSSESDPSKSLRPWDNIEDMNEAIISNWNETVTNEDRVFILGDVVINRRFLPLIAQLNAKRKILVKGNHDNFRLEEYAQYFYDILGSYCYLDVIMTHIPVHPCQKERFKANIHGHLHDKKIDDPWYKCVSLEQTNYRPLNIDDILSTLETQH